MDLLQTTLVPINLEAEEKLCGSLLLTPTITSEAMLTMKPEFFYSQAHRYIYEAICALFIDGSPVTPETVAEVLSHKKENGKSRLELVGGGRAIVKTIENLDYGEYDFWSKIVKSKHEERVLLDFANEAKALALSNPEDVRKVKSLLEEKLIQMSEQQTSASISMENSLPELSARIQRYINNPDDIIGLPSGIFRLDRAIDGFQKGNVSIFYAPSSRFKSLFTQNLGWRFAEQNIPGLWFTTEMPRVQVLERLLQLESGLNLKWLRRDRRILENKKRIERSQQRLAEYPIHFCDTSALDVSEVRAITNRHKRYHDIEYVIVDLVDHISSSRFRDEMVNNQRAVMSAFKQIAKDLDVHVILVSHVGKGSNESRQKADLDVEEMLGSGAKYQDVDAAISIAPVKYDEANQLKAQSREDIIWNVAHEGRLDVMLSITKNRHGELDRFVLELDFHKGGRFLENGWIEKKEEKQTELTMDE